MNGARRRLDAAAIVEPSGERRRMQPSAVMLGSFVVAAAWLVLPSAAAAQTASTLAGSGRPGFADGAAATATFLLPAAVAIGPHGDVYVADAAAQRVRVVREADRTVRTLAGGGPIESNAAWVTGGDADGAAESARFSVPVGIALSADGTAYVADAGNRSIRRIAPNGTVTTIARDLRVPRQLALDRAGRLYVADMVLGVVRIDPDGTRTVLSLAVKAACGVAVFERAGTMTLFVADERGILMAREGHELRIDRADRALPGTATTEGEEPIGAPNQLAALDDHTVAYTDTRDEAVRMLVFDPELAAYGMLASAADNAMHRPVGGAVTLLAGSARNDSAMSSGGFADGTAAQFDAPIGIAATSGGDLIVADAANRRIRVIRGIERGNALLEGGALPPARGGDGAYRILYVGASGIWWNTDWTTSIPGTIERELAGTRTNRAQRIEIFPSRLVGAPAAAYVSYLDTVADSGTIDAVVLDLNAGTFEGVDAPTWVGPVAGALRVLRERLARGHIAFVVVVTPLPIELGPTEQMWRKFSENAFAPALLDDEARWLDVFRTAEVNGVDLFPVFRADLSSPEHRALFGSDEAHLTPHGRAVAAHAISAALARLHPWPNSPR
jgi:guanyl-specific ribonuclease Sa